MICTGTGSAPFRGFTMRRQRAAPDSAGMTLFFGARAPDSLPYFGPLAKVPENFLKKHFAFSRVPGQAKSYVQDRMRYEATALAAALSDERTHIHLCGLKAMESGVEEAFADIARGAGLDWQEPASCGKTRITSKPIDPRFEGAGKFRRAIGGNEVESLPRPNGRNM